MHLTPILDGARRNKVIYDFPFLNFSIINGNTHLYMHPKDQLKTTIIHHNKHNPHQSIQQTTQRNSNKPLISIQSPTKTKQKGLFQASLLAYDRSSGHTHIEESPQSSQQETPSSQPPQRNQDYRRS